MFLGIAYIFITKTCTWKQMQKNKRAKWAKVNIEEQIEVKSIKLENKDKYA